LRSPPRFIADAMLGSLARKLRIFGLDTIYFTGDDAELEALAKGKRRVILTCDRGLFDHARRHGARAILVEGRTDRERLLSIRGHREASLALFSLGKASRCAVCNGELEAVLKGDAAAAGVPGSVLARHRLFYRCTSCSRSYWRGKHWDRLRRLCYSLKAKDLT
jgi:uncharacterized protein